MNSEKYDRRDSGNHKTSNYTPASTPAYRQPHALNWRYQLKGESYGDIPPSLTYRQPRALNWRYHIQ